MGGIHREIKTATWPDAWARLRRQLYSRHRRQRADCWDYRLQTLASRTHQDPWKPVLTRLARNLRGHRNSHDEWARALDNLRKAAANRRERVRGS